MAARKTVLVVEDDAALRKVLELRLVLEGFAVVLAEDGEAGLLALSRARPDAVITDLMMPRLDGYAFCERTRALEGCQALPIVVMSAHGTDVDAERLEGLGGIVFIPKPFDAPTLTATLLSLTHGDAGARAAAT